jgi:hypothetical protein
MIGKKYISPVLENIRTTPYSEELSLAAGFAKEYIESSACSRPGVFEAMPKFYLSAQCI